MVSRWTLIKNFIVEQLKGAAVKAALIKFFGTTLGLGIKGWVIKTAATTLFEDIGEPIARMVLNQVGYMYDKIEGKVIIARIKKAQDENNPGDYNSAIDDIYS